MLIDCISDLHGYYPKLEGGDLLIVAGDLTRSDDWEEHIIFCDWLSKQPYKKRIVIAGNHDNDLIDQSVGDYTFSAFDKEAGTQKSYATYLCDSGVNLILYDNEPKPLNQDCLDIKDLIRPYPRSIKIWGSPWTKTFPGMNPRCKAFTVDTEEELAEKWALIPHDVDILVTHSPPQCGLDRTARGECVGSESLKKFIFTHQPRLHVFGHVHEAYGMITHEELQRLNVMLCGSIDDELARTTIINASHVNERYEPVNNPIRIEL